ncbi:hypothetical protein [Pseudomonas sp.]|uniref:hypothetical protein n=1 Tax=Pseudomonas sp. TaxID=306 RepID=UPI0031DCDAB9
MPVPSSINDLSTTPGSNSPAGSESPGLIDDYLRTQAAFIAQLRDGRPTFAQAAGIIGSSRNLRIAIGSPSTTTSMTADEVVVETFLGGIRFCLANQNKSINISTVGVGGMDTGSAPISGYVGIYLIYNPTSSTSALLGVNATASALPLIYGGANMPSGYTASALISVWPTNGSGQFVSGTQLDREISIAQTNVLNTSTVQASLTSFSAAAAVPKNAIACRGDFTIGSSSAGASATVVLSGSAVELGRVAAVMTSQTGGAVSVLSFPSIIISSQTLYYRASVSAGTLTLIVGISSYTF